MRDFLNTIMMSIKDTRFFKNLKRIKNIEYFSVS